MLKDIQLAKMVKKIDAEFKLEPYVKQAFLDVDRKEFVSDGFKHLAYTIDALPMREEQWISSPVTVAKMTQFLELEGADSVLEVGCGSGYQAAVLSRTVRRVFTIERIDLLLREAKERFKMCGYSNIFTRHDDGQRGWGEYAPFDRIIFSATTDEVPRVLFDQLANNGMLIAPVNQNGLQIITRYYKRNGSITSEAIEPCLFVPVLSGTKT